MQGGAPRGPMMNWLPIARDFREDLRAALAQAKPTDGLEGLASLAAAGSDFWRQSSSIARWRAWA